MTIFYLPDLGEGLAEAEIREWYVAVNDEIKTDELLVAVETAKAVVDIPSPFSGTIKTLFAKAGDIIPTGAPLVEFNAVSQLEKATAESSTTVAGKLEIGHTVLRESATGIQTQQAATSAKAPPAVRSLAKHYDIDLNHIHGTGPNGSITLADVENAKQNKAPKQEAIPANAEKIHGVRRAMATTMTQAHHEVADVTIIDDANIHTWNEHTDCTARVIRAMVKATQIVPMLNIWFDGKQLTYTVHDAVHIGLAIDSPEGLFMPIIRDAQQLNLQQLRSEIDAVKMGVKNRSLTPEQLNGATICLSNFGSIAGRYANPIVVPPTVAILGVGKRYPVVLPTQQGFVAQQMLPLSLTVDHRAVTGGEAARFLHEVIVDLVKEE